MTRANFAVVLAAVWFSHATVAQTYSVVGVEPQDTLNIRSMLDQVQRYSDAPVVGTIPSRANDVLATGISIELDGQVWREVIYAEVRGWVNAGHIQVTGYPDIPDVLYCSATEPFWDLDIAGDSGILRDPSRSQAVALTVLSRRRGLGRENLWSYQLQAGEHDTVLTAIVEHTESCSDGMSDLIYGYDLFLLELRPGEGPAHGCCTASR